MKEELLSRRQQAEQSFNELQKKLTEKETEVEEIKAEMNRLQGEYRLANSLIDDDHTPEPEVTVEEENKKETVEANVIDVTGVDDGE